MSELACGQPRKELVKHAYVTCPDDVGHVLELHLHLERSALMVVELYVHARLLEVMGELVPELVRIVPWDGCEVSLFRPYGVNGIGVRSDIAGLLPLLWLR